MNTLSSVSEVALFGRVSRALLRQDQCVLRRCSERSRWYRDLGRYYAHDERRTLTHSDIDLEAFARELGVLRPGESLADPA